MNNLPTSLPARAASPARYALLLSLGLLSACLGEDDDGSNAQAPTAAPTSVPLTLTGSVVKGPVSGANVCAYTVGSAGRGASLGACVASAADGSYSLPVPALPEGLLPMVWVEASGGTYTDEVSGALSAVPTGRVLATLVDVGTVTAATAYLTPFTTLALNAAVAANQVTRTGYADAVSAMLASLGLPATLDVRTSAPILSSTPDAYGQALIAVSQMVADGLPLAQLLATADAARLSTAYTAAVAARAALPAAPVAPTAPTAPAVPTTPPAPPAPTTPTVATVTATGSLAITGASSATLVPDADGFLVTVANEDEVTLEFRKVTALTVGAGTTNVTTSVAVTKTPPGFGKPDGTTTVTVRNPNGTFNPGVPQFTVCATDCGVTISRPAGATHPVTLTFNNAAIGNLVLNGSVTGDAGGALWATDEMPRSTVGVLGIDGSASTIRRATFDLNGGTGQPTLRIVQLLMADGALVTASQQLDAAGTLVQTTVSRGLSPTQLPSCVGNGPTATCGITMATSAAGTSLRFDGTTLSDGTVLSDTIVVANTLSTLTAAPLGAFAPTRSFIKSENAVRSFTFDVLGTAAQGNISLVTVKTRGTQVFEVALSSGIASAVYNCIEVAAPSLGIPACSGGTLEADGRSIRFDRLTLVGGPLSDRRRMLTLDGTLTAKGR